MGFVLVLGAGVLMAMWTVVRQIVQGEGVGGGGGGVVGFKRRGICSRKGRRRGNGGARQIVEAEGVRL